MEEKIKSIVSDFLKMDPGKINPATIIDRSALKSSILVHRLYGTLANAGIIVNDYLRVRTFGELLENVSGSHAGTLASEVFAEQSEDDDEFGIGIDIENIQRMPSVIDFREDQFYKQNFTGREISYCAIQQSPLQSFAGLFAAKEAVVKSTGIFKNVTFNRIEIGHDVNGKPVMEGFELSISHADSIAIAVAIRRRAPNSSADQSAEDFAAQNALLTKQLRRRTGIAIASVVIAAAAIAWVIFNNLSH